MKNNNNDNEKNNVQETQRIKAEALTKRSAMKPNMKGETQVIGRVSDNNSNDEKKGKNGKKRQKEKNKV